MPAEPAIPPLIGRRVRVDDEWDGVISGLIHTETGVDALVERRRLWRPRSWHRRALAALSEPGTGNRIAEIAPTLRIVSTDGGAPRGEGQDVA